MTIKSQLAQRSSLWVGANSRICKIVAADGSRRTTEADADTAIARSLLPEPSFWMVVQINGRFVPILLTSLVSNLILTAA